MAYRSDTSGRPAETAGSPRHLGVAFAACLLLGGAFVQTASAASGHVVSLPVPKVTLKPGDVISLAVLEQKRFQSFRIDRFSVVPKSAELIGKEVIYTLPPGQPISRSSVFHRNVIKRGNPAQLIFKEQGLSIIAHVEPLEDGTVGDIVRVRNMDSGLIVRGRVQANGTISIGP
ncbi:flagellar basal body P-ring formation chaperone FlgA [Cohaesibacter celericrescens]|uniref:flagellar basal body P-ring formation chaperone FlgA n=1 Tax=Cohaesibacter celericrescens TaxID=2067669 RepID=UPI00356A0912